MYTLHIYVKMPQGANKNINKHNGTQPKKEKSKNIWQKLNFPNPIQDNPNPKILRI